MSNETHSNLKPWKPGVSGNPAGRKRGSKNIATIVRELLEQDIDIRLPLSDYQKQIIAAGGNTYAKAIAYTMALKAIQGDVRAATLVYELQAKGEANSGEAGLFQADKLVVEIVKPKHSATD